MLIIILVLLVIVNRENSHLPITKMVSNSFIIIIIPTNFEELKPPRPYY